MSKKKSILPPEVLAAQEAIEKVQAEIKTNELRAVALHKRHDALEAQLKDICPHPDLYIEDKSSYYDGSYDTMASETRWFECTICGVKSESVTKTLGYYG